MKNLLLSVAILLSSTITFAVQEGIYNCGSKDGSIKVTYKITNTIANGVTIPFVEVKTRYEATDAAPAKSQIIKGVPTEYSDDKGANSLVLGNMQIQLTVGRPSCAN